MSSARVLVMTGTDTEVGKTLVTRAVAAGLAARGRSVVAIKPVESGCNDTEQEDGRRLATATGQSAPTEALVRLTTPVAPPIAADAEGVALDASAWLATIREHRGGNDVVLVEGAGGLLSPLTWDATILDMACDLEAEMIVVVANRLGCINHAAMTVSCIRSRGLVVRAMVLSDVTEDGGDASRTGNAAALHRAIPDVPLFELPHVTDLEGARGLLAGLVAWIEKTS